MSDSEKEFARNVYQKVFEATTGLPSWYIGADEWMFLPSKPSPLTRDEAFKNVYKRSRR